MDCADPDGQFLIDRRGLRTKYIQPSRGFRPISTKYIRSTVIKAVTMSGSQSLPAKCLT